MNAVTEVPSPLVFSDSAANKVRQLIDEEGNPELKLRVFVTGGGCSGFQYGFTFDEVKNEDDAVMEKNGVMLLIDPMSYQYLVGAEIDEQHDAVLFHHGVVLVLHLVEGKAVLETRAAAAGDEHAQLELGIAFLVDQLPDLVRGAVAEHQRRRHLGNCVHFITPGSVSVIRPRRASARPL